jgi:hypothetical protein
LHASRRNDFYPSFHDSFGGSRNYFGENHAWEYFDNENQWLKLKEANEMTSKRIENTFAQLEKLQASWQKSPLNQNSDFHFFQAKCILSIGLEFLVIPKCAYCDMPTHASYDCAFKDLFPEKFNKQASNSFSMKNG